MRTREGSIISFEYLRVSKSKQVSDDSIKVYKGYSLSKNAEEYLASHGLKEATYTISVNDVNERTLGRVVACPFQVREPKALSFVSLFNC